MAQFDAPRCPHLIMKILPGALLALITWTVAADPAQVILIRHGEKPESRKDPHLTPAGRRRAVAWKDFFSARDPQPVALFAPKPSQQHPSVRPIETLEPLGQSLHLTVETPTESGDHADLARKIRSDAQYENKTVVICWVHQSLPDLARELGAKNPPAEWGAENYGTACVLTYKAGEVELKVIPDATPTLKDAKTPDAPR